MNVGPYLIRGQIIEYTTDCLTDYFEEIRNKVKFKMWFFGHYHDNKNIVNKRNKGYIIEEKK